MPFVRVDGELSPTTFEAMSAADTEAAALALMPEHERREFEATSEANFGHTLAGVGRFRINVFRQRSMVGLAIRRVRSEVPTVAELMLPPVMAELAESSRGLVLVTGPTGTGKTTTIASMIGHINRTRRAQRDDRVATPRDAVRRQGALPRGRRARLDGPFLRPDHRPGGDDRDPRHHRRGCFYGMQTFDQALVGLVESGLVPRRTPGSPPRAHTTSSSRSAGRCFEADQASSPAARRAARSIGCLR